MGGQVQVISGDGTYAGDAVEAFLQGHAVSNSGVGYTTVAIMGPQSSGKSTLLNAVVRFRFAVALDQRSVSSCAWRHWFTPHRTRPFTNAYEDSEAFRSPEICDFFPAWLCTTISCQAYVPVVWHGLQDDGRRGRALTDHPGRLVGSIAEGGGYADVRP